MAFCEQCGTRLGTGAAFCGSCGSSVASERQSSTTARVQDAPANHVATAGQDFGRADGIAVQPQSARIEDIPALSEKWRLRFAVIEKAGGERARWWKWSEWKQLTWKEKRLITSNLWGFVFGPLYYVYLGMWRKAITLMLVVTVIDVIIGMTGDALDVPLDKSLWLVSALAFKQCANIDYYRKIVLNRREWW